LTTGFVHLVGAGPGDPGLLTVRGRDCLRAAEVVIYDYLANPLLLEEAPADAERIYVGKSRGHHHRPQEEINALLVEQALSGKRVVRLKGGDPFIFGRGGEEAQVLRQHNIPFEIVPGVTAGHAAAAYAGIPLTHRDYTTSLSMVTGHLDASKDLDHIDWAHLGAGSGTLVFYMGVANLARIAAELISHGRPASTPVALVRWATLPSQETLVGTLADIAAQVVQNGFKPPAVIIVGEVVRLRNELRWFDNRPLFGKRILITRSLDQAADFAARLRELGAEPLLCPTIAIAPLHDYAELDAAIADLADTDYLILTSVNAVDAFFARLADCGKDARALAGVTLVTVGPKTAAALAQFGLCPDLMPTDYRAEGVVALLRDKVAGKKILYPKAALARDLIVLELTAAGANLCAPAAYGSAPPAGAASALHTALADGVDLLTFTASSTVRNFIDLLRTDDLPLATAIPVASIGPLTSETARQAGLDVAIEPEESTIEAMIEAMIAFFSKM